jgi:hypothetical protein
MMISLATSSYGDVLLRGALRDPQSVPHMPKDGATLTESVKIEVAIHIENATKLLGKGDRLITATSRRGSGACM